VLARAHPSLADACIEILLLRNELLDSVVDLLV
jgi:hypothetical protein